MPFTRYLPQPEFSVPTLVDTQTPIGAQIENQLPHKLLPDQFRNLPLDFPTRSSASVDPEPYKPQSELSQASVLQKVWSMGGLFLGQGWSPQLPEAGGLGARGSPSTRKFCIFFAKVT